MADNTDAQVVAFVSQRIHARAELLRALYALLKDDVVKWAQIDGLVPATDDAIDEARDGVANLTNNQLRSFMAMAQGIVSTVEDEATQALVALACIRSLSVTVSLPQG